MSKKVGNQKNQRIQVFARCRPLNALERKQASPSVVEVIPEKKEILLRDRNSNREFLFDKVFSPDTKQIAVYKSVVEPLIKEVLNGYNCTVFAYGQTGTGKTYTMEGERKNTQCSWEDDPGAGIIPRSLHQLFEELNKEKNVEFSVRVSFLELYNEELFDLLSSTDFSRLRLYEDTNRKGSVIIQGLEEIVVNNKDEVYTILEKGTSKRQTAATMLNATSSRSHTVFSVTIHIKENTIDGEELLKTGKLNLVDLAGSENVGRSGAIDKRAREAGNINQSLLTLGRVITALIEKQPHVPYRESKLTRLLQDSLGGHTKTSIIATISPALCNFDETISTLDYATKAKSITIKPEVNQKMTKRALIREYTEEIERLRKDLVALRSKDGFFIDSDNYMTLLNSVTEKSDLIKELSDKLEVLIENKRKIEEMFDSTKEELSKTHEKLTETTQKFEETANELSNKNVALSYTQEVLSKTTLDRDEKQYLINIQKNTEKKLANQAHALLQVADQTTDDVDKLHAKIERKEVVEMTNERRCQDFRKMYQQQFAKLDDMVTGSKNEQIQSLETIKDDLVQLGQAWLLQHKTQPTFVYLVLTHAEEQLKDNLFSGLAKYEEQTSTCFLNVLTQQGSLLNDFSCNLNSGTADQKQLVKNLLEKMDSIKEKYISEHQAFLTKSMPKLFGDLNTKNVQMDAWFHSMRENLCQKINNHKNALAEQSARKKELLHSINETLESFYARNEEILEELKGKTESLSNQINEMAAGLVAFSQVFTKREKDAKKNINRIKDAHLSIKNNAAILQAVEEPLLQMKSKEKEFELRLAQFGDISQSVNVEEFSAKKESILQSQNSLSSDITRFMEHNQKLKVEDYEECKSSFAYLDSTLERNLRNNECIVKVITSSLSEELNKSEHSLKEQNVSLTKIVNHSENSATESTKKLDMITPQLKGEILKRDLEFEKFISEDLIKDIHTGTTPQRKSFVYPKILAATSPHDRLLQRYRSQLATDTAIVVSLPLDNSFNESEESKHSPGEDISGDLNSCNPSFTTDDNDSTGCESDSNASTMSDVSVENCKNKENSKSLKKSSRLPKRLAKFQGFAKPAPVSIRKPLFSNNSDNSTN